MQTLRLEKAFPLYGKDISEDVTPFQVGLDRFIRFEKREFIGREALLRAQERGLEMRWVGLTIQGDLPAAPDAKVFPVGAMDTTTRKLFSGPEAGVPVDPVLPGDQEIGAVTFSARGHTVGKVLAMAHLRAQYAWPGSRVMVMVKDRPVPAVVTPTPFFDPQGARLRALSR
jgi:aminomethyltransferase